VREGRAGSGLQARDLDHRLELGNRSVDILARVQSTRDEDPTQQALSPQDLLWLAVDECAAAWLGDDPARLLERFHDLPGTTGTERLTALHGSGHPDAAALADHLARSGAEQSQPSVYQLKISLTGWGVWRRVLVRPTLTLGDLHEVIRTVLDWDDDHLHLFQPWFFPNRTSPWRICRI
jgi:hypothetical protein